MVVPVVRASASDEVMFSRRTVLSISVRCTPICFIGRLAAISTCSMSMLRAVASPCAAAVAVQRAESTRRMTSRNTAAVTLCG